MHGQNGQRKNGQINSYKNILVDLLFLVNILFVFNINSGEQNIIKRLSIIKSLLFFNFHKIWTLVIFVIFFNKIKNIWKCILKNFFSLTILSMQQRIIKKKEKYEKTPQLN